MYVHMHECFVCVCMHAYMYACTYVCIEHVCSIYVPYANNCILLAHKTIKFYLIKLTTDFYWQPSYLLDKISSLDIMSIVVQ